MTGWFRISRPAGMAIWVGIALASPPHAQVPATPVPDATPAHQCVVDRTGAKIPPSGKTTLRIGARKDARPFAYRSSPGAGDIWSSQPAAPMAARNYTGYVSKICDIVLSDMLLNPPEGRTEDDWLSQEDIEIIDIGCLSDPIERNPGQTSTPAETTEADPATDSALTGRFEHLGKDLDIICDPSTITNERRHGFAVSPPIFLSGIGLINRKGQAPAAGRCPPRPLIGYVRGTTAYPEGLHAIIQAEELKRYKDDLIAALKEPDHTCPRGLIEQRVLIDFKDYDEASRNFCNGRFLYYLGDREIIASSARSIAGCEIENAGRTYTQDRYAIFGKIRYDDPERALWTAHFFDLLSQKIVITPSVLDRALESTFLDPDSILTRDLELFLWSIRGRK